MARPVRGRSHHVSRGLAVWAVSILGVFSVTLWAGLAGAQSLPLGQPVDQAPDQAPDQAEVRIQHLTEDQTKDQIGALPQNPILTIDSERFFTDSEFGRRIAAAVEAESVELAAENRQIEADLTAEEKDLTARRADMSPTEFRALADAFDTKVQSIRQTQDAKARALSTSRDTDRVTFLRAAQPVLETILNETGASVILERSSVFFSSNASDITDRAIAGINASIGAGQPTQP